MVTLTTGPNLSYTHDKHEAEALGLHGCPFYRLHIPTGQLTEDVVYIYFRADFSRLLQEWNRTGGVTWKYWEK